MLANVWSEPGFAWEMTSVDVPKSFSQEESLGWFVVVFRDSGTDDLLLT